MKNFESFIFEIIADTRKGKGPWIVWFPKETKTFESPKIKNGSDLQALSAWIVAINHYNNIFKKHKNISYNGKLYSKDQAKILYSDIVKNNDWESVDYGSPISLTKKE